MNIRKGGTLTVLRECLRYLSAHPEWYRVTALVHNRALCDYPGIDYIEIPWSIKSWPHRLYCEYCTMYDISRSLPALPDLWFSLHDTTPRVVAARQAVYCHTSFPFMKATWQDVKMDYKIALFSKLTRFAYRINVRKNRYLVVQQQWMRDALSGIIRFDRNRIIVAPPSFTPLSVPEKAPVSQEVVFLYPATADCHKNFETLCQASRLLEERVGKGRFKTVLTLSGRENKYAAWLYSQYKDVSSVCFQGFLSKEELALWYAQASCLVFPSRVETWGLPISEFKPTGKPMLLADLPYAHETAAGASCVCFFPATDARLLSERMADVLENDLAGFDVVPCAETTPPYAGAWEDLFNLLLQVTS